MVKSPSTYKSNLEHRIKDKAIKDIVKKKGMYIPTFKDFTNAIADYYIFIIDNPEYFINQADIFIENMERKGREYANKVMDELFCDKLGEFITKRRSRSINTKIIKQNYKKWDDQTDDALIGKEVERIFKQKGIGKEEIKSKVNEFHKKMEILQKDPKYKKLSPSISEN